MLHEATRPDWAGWKVDSDSDGSGGSFATVDGGRIMRIAYPRRVSAQPAWRGVQLDADGGPRHLAGTFATPELARDALMRAERGGVASPRWLPPVTTRWTRLTPLDALGVVTREQDGLHIEVRELGRDASGASQGWTVTVAGDVWGRPIEDGDAVFHDGKDAMAAADQAAEQWRRDAGLGWVHAKVDGLDRWATVSDGRCVQVVQQMPTGPGEPPQYAAACNRFRVQTPSFDDPWTGELLEPARDVFATPEEAAEAAGRAAFQEVRDDEGGVPCCQHDSSDPRPPDDPTTEPARSAIAGAFSQPYADLWRPLKASPPALLPSATASRVLGMMPPDLAAEVAVQNYVESVRRYGRWAVSNWPELAPRDLHGDDPFDELIAACGTAAEREANLDARIEALLQDARNPQPFTPADHPLHAAKLAPDSPWRDIQRAEELLQDAMARCEAAEMDGTAHARQCARRIYGRALADDLMETLDRIGASARDSERLKAAAASIHPPIKAERPDPGTSLQQMTAVERHDVARSSAAFIFDLPQFRPLGGALEASRAAYAADGYTGRSPASHEAHRQVQDALQAAVDAGYVDGGAFGQQLMDSFTQTHDMPRITVQVAGQAC